MLLLLDICSMIIYDIWYYDYIYVV